MFLFITMVRKTTLNSLKPVLNAGRLDIGEKIVLKRVLVTGIGPLVGVEVLRPKFLKIGNLQHITSFIVPCIRDYLVVVAVPGHVSR